jgi:hypothetical protein
MKVIMLSILILCASCSSLKRSVLAGALSGGLAGAAGGAVFSPNRVDQNKNTYVFGLLGAVVGAGIGYLFYDEPKSKAPLNPILMDENKSASEELKKEIPLFDFAPELKNVRPEITFKPVGKYEVPMAKLPKELEGKVKKQFIIEYQTEAKTMEIDNRTIEIGPFKAWEHTYEK